MSARTEVMDISYPVCLLNAPPHPQNGFDRSCFPPCQSQLAEGSRDWTSTGGQEHHNYRQKEGRGGGGLFAMFDVIYPTAPRVPLNGPLDIDGVLLSIGLHAATSV